MSKKKINNIAKDTNKFLVKYFKKSKKNRFNQTNVIRFTPWWKKN